MHSKLTIPGVFLEDAGHYRCSARNSVFPTPVKSAFATLSVNRTLYYFTPMPVFDGGGGGRRRGNSVELRYANSGKLPVNRNVMD